MIYLSIEFVPKQYLTGYGVPLVYAPNWSDIAEVGPINPPKFVYGENDYGENETLQIPPVVECYTTYGSDWRHNPVYYK